LGLGARLTVSLWTELCGYLFIKDSFVSSNELPNQKMTPATFNTSFHMDLGRFVGDWTHNIQRLK
jgi:hypothetical protein